MTRKQYIRKLQALTLAIYNHPESIYPKDHKIGESLRYNRDHANQAIETFGSYKAAWNHKGMVWARNFYGVDPTE